MYTTTRSSLWLTLVPITLLAQENALTKYIIYLADDTAPITHGKSRIEASINLQYLLNIDTKVVLQEWHLVPDPRYSQYIDFSDAIQVNSPPVNVFN